MKRISALLVLLVILCGYTWHTRQEIKIIKENEERLCEENAALRNELDEYEAMAKEKEEEAGPLFEALSAMEKEAELWDRRTEELQAYLPH